MQYLLCIIWNEYHSVAGLCVLFAAMYILYKYNTHTHSVAHSYTHNRFSSEHCAENGEWKESHNDGTFAGIVSYECRKNDCIDINSFSLLLYFLDTAARKEEVRKKLKINTARRIVVFAAARRYACPLRQLSPISFAPAYTHTHSVQPNKYKHLFYCQHNLEASAQRILQMKFQHLFLWLASSPVVSRSSARRVQHDTASVVYFCRPVSVSPGDKSVHK